VAACVQEIDRLNVVIKLTKTTLTNLRLAIAGSVALSGSLIGALSALFIARIPATWLAKSWEAATLGNWFTGLLQRFDQLVKWVNNGRPKSFWLTGFFNPQGFLTAMKQVRAPVATCFGVNSRHIARACGRQRARKCRRWRCAAARAQVLVAPVTQRWVAPCPPPPQAAPPCVQLPLVAPFHSKRCVQAVPAVQPGKASMQSKQDLCARRRRSTAGMRQTSGRSTTSS
jgi:Dynein heavy chain C-terminal domain